MKILVTGATGFVGKRLCEELVAKNFEVHIVTRNMTKAKEDLMLPLTFHEGDLSKETINFNTNFDAVVNLMGENIGEKKWDEEQKKIILNSRATSVKNLYESLKENNGVSFIQAGAIGFYRDSKEDEWLDESTEKGDFFLSDVCDSWEQSSLQFKNNFNHHLILRIGVVLGFDGALMHKLLPLYRKGLGGKLGNGKQWMSWIHRDDLVSLIVFSIENKLSGVLNAVAPEPIQNKAFNTQLSYFVERPALFSVPAFILKLIMGAQSYLALSSQRIKSSIPANFKFSYPSLKDALKEICSYKHTMPINREAFHNRFRQVQFIDLPIEKVFEFFSDAKNLERITPDMLNFKITYQSTPKIQDGTVFKYKLKVHGIPVHWKTNITNWNTNEKFTDYQEKGPYQVWDHTHLFIECQGGTLMVDDVLFRLPLGYIGELGGLWLVNKDVPDIFKYRAQEMKRYLKA
jgi:uncharacterized protein (TIGR01777 family)